MSLSPTATVLVTTNCCRSGYHVWLHGSRGYELDQNWQTINLQDHVVIHVNEGGSPTSIGDWCPLVIPFFCMLAELQDECLIGMRASVMDDAVVESGAMVAGGAVVVP